MLEIQNPWWFDSLLKGTQQQIRFDQKYSTRVVVEFWRIKVCQKRENLKLQYHVVLINFGLKIENVGSLFVNHPTRRCRVYKMLELVCSKCIEEFACESAISVRRKIDRRTYCVRLLHSTWLDGTG